MKKPILLALCFLPFFLLGFATQAKVDPKAIYQFDGKIESLSANTLIVKRGNETLEFELGSSASETIPKVHVGDSVTIWYTLQAREIVFKKLSKKELPGQASPEHKRELPKGKIIEDDRIFYDA